MGHGFVYGGPVVCHLSSVASGSLALCSVDTSSRCPHSLDACVQLCSHLFFGATVQRFLTNTPVDPGFESTTIYRDSSPSRVALIIHTGSQVLAVLLCNHVLQPESECALRLAHALGTFKVTVTSQTGMSQQLRKYCDSDVCSVS